MQIENLAHILRAARSLTGETVFVLVGSQAVLAQFPSSLPAAMRMSMEADIWPKDRPEMAEIIEGAMGADSPFHGTFGYHAVGISPETALLPARWQDRAIRLEGHPLLEGAVGICPEIHDLCASKLMAFREKDLVWVGAACEAGLADPDVVISRLLEIETDGDEERAARRASALRWVSAVPGAALETGDTDAGPR